IREDNSRGSLQQREIFGGQVLRAPYEDAAVLVEHVRLDARTDKCHYLVVSSLTVNGVFVVHDDEVHDQSFKPPVSMRLQEFADEIEPVGVRRTHEHDRQVSRDAEAPEIALAAAVLEKHVLLGAALRLAIEKCARQPAKELRLRFGGVQVTQ